MRHFHEGTLQRKDMRRWNIQRKDAIYNGRIGEDAIYNGKDMRRCNIQRKGYVKMQYTTERICEDAIYNGRISEDAIYNGRICKDAIYNGKDICEDGNTTEGCVKMQDTTEGYLRKSKILCDGGVTQETGYATACVGYGIVHWVCVG